jgi:Uncharacterized protein conserved in bacteria (DUF2130)
MPRKRPRLNPTVLVDLAEMRHRLLNDTTPNANAAHQLPIAVNLPVLAQCRVPQIHGARSNLTRHCPKIPLVGNAQIRSSRCAVAVAITLRESLIALAAARLAGEGQQTKMELVYQYLTGPRFRHRIEAVVERFTDMQADLDRERKTMMRLWAKREEQIRGVVESTAGLYGDLQGIAGRSLLEIDGLELPLLDGPAAGEAAE